MAKTDLGFHQDPKLKYLPEPNDPFTSQYTIVDGIFKRVPGPNTKGRDKYKKSKST